MLYVGRLARKVKYKDLLELFREFGEISRCEMKRGFAFVTFEEIESAEEAIFSLHKSKFLGSKIVVEWSKSSRIEESEEEEERIFSRDSYDDEEDQENHNSFQPEIERVFSRRNGHDPVKEEELVVRRKFSVNNTPEESGIIDSQIISLTETVKRLTSSNEDKTIEIFELRGKLKKFQDSYISLELKNKEKTKNMDESSEIIELQRKLREFRDSYKSLELKNKEQRKNMEIQKEVFEREKKELSRLVMPLILQKEQEIKEKEQNDFKICHQEFEKSKQQYFQNHERIEIHNHSQNENVYKQILEKNRVIRNLENIIKEMILREQQKVRSPPPFYSTSSSIHHRQNRDSKVFIRKKRISSSRDNKSSSYSSNSISSSRRRRRSNKRKRENDIDPLPWSKPNKKRKLENKKKRE